MGRNQRERKQKRERRQAERRWTAQVFEGPPNGPDVVSPSVEEVMAAIETMPQELTWEVIASEVVPLFQRVRPYHPSMPEQLRIVVPPGLSVGFGVDIGPAFITVSPEMAEEWGVRADDILARALANLEGRMAAVRPRDVYDGTIGDMPVRILQSPTGSASTYVLVPQALGRILGRHRQLVLAPMRNLLISLPIGADRELAAWLFDEFAAQDPNCLAPTAFVVGDGHLALEPLGASYGAA
ncbi:MAG TPA: hypothetical protein VFU17_03910 [Candidatus Limnocylindrales bacterium]|nr:hypothetical protein [Candidatus Limnocylindrales bacterium]